MEVTSVVRQTVILMLFYIANGHGQLPLQFSSSNIVQAGNRPHPPSAVAGIPGILLQDLPPSALAQDTAAYPHLSLPQSYRTELKKAQRPSPPPLYLSLFSSVKNAGYFLLALLDLTDADRHESLRSAANNLNAAVDSISIFVQNVIDVQKKIKSKMATLPVIGFMVQMLDQVQQMLIYIPMKIFEMAKKLLRKAFSTKPDHTTYPVAGILPYAYA